MIEEKIFETPENILQHLIQFNTTNPPGNEKACISYISDLLTSVGYKVQLYSKDENRPNLVCRLKGKGKAEPIMVYGHVDVVTTADQEWTYPPFNGEIHDGFVWGRGALDMKGGIAMMVAAMMRMKAEGIEPDGDVILLVLSDEENNGTFGAEFMVNEHPEVFDGVKYALGEFGGFNLSIGGKRFYPIQVAEKQICTLRITVRGPGGHGSGVVPNNAMKKLGAVLTKLNASRLPVHVGAPVNTMIEKITAELGFPMGTVMKLLLKPFWTDKLLDRLGMVGLGFIPMFHNMVNATIIRGGEKVNVIPSEISMVADGRLLPGFTPDDMVAEVEKLIGMDDVSVEVERYEEGPASINMGLFNHLASVLEGLDDEGVPVPLLLTAVTDGRFLAKLGIQSYGFLPMQLPDDFEFLSFVHAADERIPVAAVRFGAEGLYKALSSYSG